MPVYCYKCPACESVKELCRTMEERNDAVLCEGDGFVMNRDFLAESGGYVHTPGTWPMLSDAMGVHPDQIHEASKEAASLGVPTQFTADGRAVLTGPQHRKKLCEAYGFYDKNASFGDPTPRHRTR
jgi:hypothetical protein